MGFRSTLFRAADKLFDPFLLTSVFKRVGASLVAQLVKNPPAMQETWIQSLGWKIPRRSERLSTPVFWPGELHGQYKYSPQGHKEFDTTEPLSFSLSHTR